MSLLPSEPEPWRPSVDRPPLSPGALLFDLAGGISGTPNQWWVILSQYLDLQSLCRLDSALCIKSERDNYLRLLSSKLLIFNRNDGYKTELYCGNGFCSATAMDIGALNWVSKRGIHLASLGLARTNNVGSSYYSQCVILNLTIGGDYLEQLESFYGGHDSKMMTFSMLTSIVTRSSKTLKCINLTDSSILTSSAAFIKQCKLLQVVSLIGHESTEETIDIFKNCPDLRRVEFTLLLNNNKSLADEVLHGMATHCHNLEAFYLCRVNGVTAVGLNAVFGSCKKLTTVIIGGLTTTDEIVETMSESCPQLEIVAFRGCARLTNRSVLALAKLRHLTHVVLTYNTKIESSALANLFRNCKELKYIGLTAMNLVTDQLLTVIATNSSKLIELHVDRCSSQVTGVGLGAVCFNCKKLKVVYISKDMGNNILNSLRRTYPHVSIRVVEGVANVPVINLF